MSVHYILRTSALAVASMVAVSASLTAPQGRVREILPASQNQPPPEARTAGAWSAIKLAPGVLAWISDVGLKSRVKEELDKLRPAALQRAPEGGGTLIIVAISESKSPDVNGEKQRYFLDARIAVADMTPEGAVKKLMSRDRLETGAPSGFVRRESLFWVTR